MKVEFWLIRSWLTGCLAHFTFYSLWFNETVCLGSKVNWTDWKLLWLYESNKCSIQFTPFNSKPGDTLLTELYLLLGSFDDILIAEINFSVYRKSKVLNTAYSSEHKRYESHDNEATIVGSI